VAISGFSDDDESCTTEGRVAQVVAISVASLSHFDGKKTWRYRVYTISTNFFSVIYTPYHFDGTRLADILICWEYKWYRL
jgi:hypothetical protein